MNKEKLLKEIEETKKHLANLEEQIKSINENKRWKPKYNEEYYIISDAETYRCDFYNDDYDKRCLSVGNYFKTKEEVEFEIERLKVLEELKEFSYDFSDEEWKNTSIFKYYFYYSYYYDEIKVCDTMGYKYDNIYFKSKEDYKRAIVRIGEERLKKYYFKVGI